MTSSVNAMLSSLAGRQVLELTTTGRNSGKLRTIEIWFIFCCGRIYLLAEHGERAGWVRNIAKNSGVTIRIGDSSFAGSARVIDPSAEQDLCSRVRDAGRAKYGWGDGLPIEITVEAFAGAS